MSKKDNGAGFTAGFTLGGLFGGLTGYLLGHRSKNPRETDEIGLLLADINRRSKEFVVDIKRILADALSEGRRAARETKKSSNVDKDDIHLDNPEL
jgi:hypothetical protein